MQARPAFCTREKKKKNHIDEIVEIKVEENS